MQQASEQSAARRRLGRIRWALVTLALLAVLGCQRGDSPVVATPPPNRAPVTTVASEATRAPAASPAAAAPSAAAASPQAGGQPAAPPSGQLAAPAERATVRVGYAPVYSLAPTFIAKDKGYFDRQGLDVELELITSGPEGFAATAAGHLQVTTTSPAAAVLNGWNSGVDIRMIAAEQAFLPEGPAGAALIVRRELRESGQVTTPADLRGRKLAINAQGTATEFEAEEALRTGGIGVADVDLILMPFPDVVPALTNGAIDAALALEPLATETQERGVGVPLVTDFMRGAQVTVIIANSNWLRDQPDVAARYVAGYLQGVRDLYGDGWRRDDNVAIIEKWTRIPAATVKRVLPSYIDPNGEINVGSLQRMQQFFAERGYLRYSQPLDLRAYIDDGPRQAAVRQLGPFTPR